MNDAHLTPEENKLFKITHQGFNNKVLLEYSLKSILGVK